MRILINPKPIKLTDLTEKEEYQILSAMMRIDGIYRYLELQKQGSYSLYAKYKDDKFIGIAEFCDSLLNSFDKLNKEEQSDDYDTSGYQSSVE